RAERELPVWLLRRGARAQAAPASGWQLRFLVAKRGRVSGKTRTCGWITLCQTWYRQKQHRIDSQRRQYDHSQAEADDRTDIRPNALPGDATGTAQVTSTLSDPDRQGCQQRHSN